MSVRSGRVILLSCVVVFGFGFLAFAELGVPELVKDISTATGNSNADYFVYDAGTFYFAATDADYDRELWKMDESTGETTRVKNILEFSSSSPQYFYNVNGTVLFWTHNELWTTDGTPGGTTRIMDSSWGTLFGTSSSMGLSNGYLYFCLNNADTIELWRTGGTAGTTAKVDDLFAYVVGCSAYYFVDANGTLFFVADDKIHGRELWKSDGTPGGTGLVLDLNPSGNGLNGAVVLGDIVMFAGDDGGGLGNELYKSDGITITRVKDIWTGSGSSSPANMTAVNGKVYFRAAVGTTKSLWVSDGTEGNTVALAAMYPSNFIGFGGKVYFTAGGDIWTTDGTAENTDLFLADTEFREQVVSGTKLYFLSGHPSTGAELRAIDGTPGVTELVWTFLPDGLWPSKLCAGAGTLAFTAHDVAKGEEPWISDGTPGGTRIVADINTASLGSNASYSGLKPYFAEMNGVGYFALETNAGLWDAYGNELWRSDGTDDGTYMVKDIYPGSTSSDPEGFTRAGDTLFFKAKNDTHAQELWKSDGTESETWRATGGYPEGDGITGIVGAVDDRIIIGAYNGFSYNIFGGDGTQFSNLVPNAQPNGRGVMLNGQLIFSAAAKLWSTDGTGGGGAIALADLDYYGASHLTKVGNKAFFFAENINLEPPSNARQLWVTDGTSIGTGPLTQWPDNTVGVITDANVAVGNLFFFEADDSTDYSNRQLWKCDTTDPDFIPHQITTTLNAMVGNLRDAVDFNGVYFATDGSVFIKSDGSDANTTVVNGPLRLDLELGPLTPLGEYLYFVASETVGDRELWRTDGTENGAERVMDIIPGSNESKPEFLGKLVETSAGKELADTETLLFFANHPTFGRELWKIEELAVSGGADTTAPVITLNGLAVMNLERDIDTYTEPGATATDNVDPSVSVTIGGDTVDTSSNGTYVVTYDAVDVAGNPAIQLTRSVIVGDPLGLCDVLAQSDALLAQFRSNFGVSTDNLAGTDPIYDLVYTDEAALALADAGACPGTNPNIANATHAAFDQNRDALVTLANASPGHPELRSNMNIIAALGLLSAARRDGVIGVLDGAGINTSGLLLKSVYCSGGDCYPPVVKSDTKEDQTEPFSASGDLDGDGVPNGLELQNVLAAGGDVDDFGWAASNGASDGTVLNTEGSIEVTIEPAAARDLGAQWRVEGGAWCDSGDIVSALTVGDYTVSFSTLPGCWDSPGEITVTVTQNETATETGTYVQLAAPAAPDNVQASDGTFPDRIQVSWAPVAKSITEYRVYRSESDNANDAQAVSDWITATQFDDTTADPAVAVGCASEMTFSYYHYWVKTRNREACESSMSVGDLGHCGEEDKSTVYERVLPKTRFNEEARLACPESVLAIRLRSEDGIDVASLWGYVTGPSVDTEVVEWLSVSDEDGWVLCRPEGAWPSSETLTMMVFAKTLAGEDLGPVSYRFFIAENSGEDATAKLWQPQCYVDYQPVAPEFDAGSKALVSVVALDAMSEYVLGPDQAFEIPQRVWLPVPDGADTADVRLFYYHEDKEGGAWHPAENVEGWLASDEFLTLDIDGVTYLGIQVWHGGTVQLHILSTPKSASALPGDVLVLIVYAIGMLIVRRRRGRRRAATVRVAARLIP